MNIDSDFTIVELEQGSPEWHEWRSDGIGATNAKVAMGKHGKGFDRLLRVKAGLEEESDYLNVAMILGAELEPEARTKYISRTGTIVKPVCVQSTKHKWLRASLDGLTEDHSGVVEIKCGARVYEIVDETASIPGYYYSQTQHILAVTGLWSLDFWCHWPGSPNLLVNVPRNDDYIKNLLEKEEEFWNLVLSLRKTR
jgi:putative phage-type endonuclease